MLLYVAHVCLTWNVHIPRFSSWERAPSLGMQVWFPGLMGPHVWLFLSLGCLVLSAVVVVLSSIVLCSVVALPMAVYSFLGAECWLLFRSIPLCRHHGAFYISSLLLMGSAGWGCGTQVHRCLSNYNLFLILCTKYGILEVFLNIKMGMLNPVYSTQGVVKQGVQAMLPHRWKHPIILYVRT